MGARINNLNSPLGGNIGSSLLTAIELLEFKY
jgi:hypothetical protein